MVYGGALCVNYVIQRVSWFAVNKFVTIGCCCLERIKINMSRWDSDAVFRVRKHVINYPCRVTGIPNARWSPDFAPLKYCGNYRISREPFLRLECQRNISKVGIGVAVRFSAVGVLRCRALVKIQEHPQGFFGDNIAINVTDFFPDCVAKNILAIFAPTLSCDEPDPRHLSCMRLYKSRSNRCRYSKSSLYKICSSA